MKIRRQQRDRPACREGAPWGRCQRRDTMILPERAAAPSAFTFQITSRGRAIAGDRLPSDGPGAGSAAGRADSTATRQGRAPAGPGAQTSMLRCRRHVQRERSRCLGRRGVGACRAALPGGETWLHEPHGDAHAVNLSGRGICGTWQGWVSARVPEPARTRPRADLGPPRSCRQNSRVGRAPRGERCWPGRSTA